MSLFTAVYGVECEDCGEQIWSHDWINEAGAMRGACSAGWTVNEPERIEGHHEDYSKPLEVLWLCRQCHARLHEEKRGLGTEAAS